MLGVSCVVVLWFRNGSGQATYKGKRVEQWVAGVRDFRTAATDKDILAMMSHLGTNALAPLVEILASDSRTTEHIYRTIVQYNLPSSLKSFATNQLSKHVTLRRSAAAILPLLPDGGVAAIPTLEAHASDTNSPSSSWVCLVGLASIGPRGVPALHRLETNSLLSFKGYVAGWLGINLQQGDRRQRERSAVTLALFDPTSYHPIPMLNDMCDSRDAATRHEAFEALTNLIPIHAAARDAMKKIAAESSDEILRDRAKDILDEFYSGLRARKSP